MVLDLLNDSFAKETTPKIDEIIGFHAEKHHFFRLSLCEGASRSSTITDLFLIFLSHIVLILCDICMIHLLYLCTTFYFQNCEDLFSYSFSPHNHGHAHAYVYVVILQVGYTAHTYQLVNMTIKV